MKSIRNFLSYTFNPSFFEVKFSTVITVAILYVFMIIGVHTDFSFYQDFLIEIITNVLGAQISLMGVLITALALMVTILNNSDYVKSINDLNVEKNVDNLLDDFPYISILILFHIILSLVLIFLMKSELNVAPVKIFYSLLAIYVYIFINIIVRVSLVSSIMVKVFKGIRNLMKLSILESKEVCKHKKVYYRKQSIYGSKARFNRRKVLKKGKGVKKNESR